MGTIQSEYYIIEGAYENDVTKIDKYIKEEINKDYQHLFIKAESISNSYVQYFVNWDGSKEGWTTSDEAKLERINFFRFLLTECKYIQIIQIVPAGELFENQEMNIITKINELEGYLLEE